MLKHINRYSKVIVPFIASRLPKKYSNRGKMLAFYPPFALMGVKVLHSHANPARLSVRLPLSWRSSNPSGSMFGGFQSAVADPIAPILCLMMLEASTQIESPMHVWTRHLELDYFAPLDDDLLIDFTISETEQSAIEAELKSNGRADPLFTFDICRAHDGRACTRVKTVVTIKHET